MKKKIKAPKWYLEERKMMDDVMENFAQQFLGVGGKWLETQIEKDNFTAIATIMKERKTSPEIVIKMRTVIKYLIAYSHFSWERLRMEHLNDDLIYAKNISYNEQKQEFEYE